MGHGTRERTWTEIERRIVCGELPGGARIDEDALAGDLAVETPVVREGYPVVILLEGLAVRSTAQFPPESIARLREINAAMAEEGANQMAAATRDWEFHDELVRHCGNEQLLSTLRPLKRLMLRYEYHYMATEDFVSRSVHQHEAIIEALENGDRERASALVEDNFRDSMPGILEQL